MTVMHCFCNFYVETGGHLAVPVFNKVHKMYPDSVLFLRTSVFMHYVTRWKEMFGQRFSMIHITKDMANFDAVELPPKSAVKRRL
jgi:hypothetical protein